MRAQPREEDHNINIIMCIGMATGEYKGKKLETKGWEPKVAEKEVGFHLNQAKETFTEAKNKFFEASMPGSQEKLGGNSEVQDVDPSFLTTLLKTFMKLLRDQKVVEGLQEFIENFSSQIKIPSEQCTMRKLAKHKKWTRRKMSLTAQIGEYEKDKVILDLGYDANGLPKMAWKRMR